MKLSIFQIVPILVITSSLFADMPLPFPEESGVSETENNTIDSSGKKNFEIVKPNETKTEGPESKDISTEASAFSKKDSLSQDLSSEESSNKESLPIQESKTTNVSSSETSQPLQNPSEDSFPAKTILPNTSKTSLKKKKDKKKEDPSESGYKKGLLRLRENQRNNAKNEFNQSSGQGKSANASRLEDARLTAENSSDTNSITEQIDSEDEKWQAVFEVARVLRGNGKTSEAETQYLKIITEAPENFQSISLLSLGEMLSSTDRKDSAKRYLLQLVKLLRKKPELDPQKDQLEKAVTLIARIYGDQGKYEEAENWAKTYLNRLNPEASENSPFVKELRRILKRRYY
ncbi:tetratricopeptide repeat protein [Leptospira alstonii]|uniref:Tetratricopeptide repeat domain protein n=2 Tax=Leptospira alstonii TaxID=28452 RepID=M6CW62_9LEPT|nr:tetratricopeptide repeat protein [Leptospira alstonii]EMJ93163.1 tetratricopeptide repeat domain protein [Leptospira alstonii serovar Sichuan str. 79601]EQA78379.1 tetratricopeptide repeat protein [Leptospira alstonii serovar Pingchang str. 80-412]